MPGKNFEKTNYKTRTIFRPLTSMEHCRNNLFRRVQPHLYSIQLRGDDFADSRLFSCTAVLELFVLSDNFEPTKDTATPTKVQNSSGVLRLVARSLRHLTNVFCSTQGTNDGREETFDPNRAAPTGILRISKSRHASDLFSIRTKKRYILIFSDTEAPTYLPDNLVV